MLELFTLLLLLVCCSLAHIFGATQGFRVPPMSPPAHQKESRRTHSEYCYDTPDDDACYCACGNP